MSYPTDVLATGELVTAAQINRWMVMLADTTVTGSAAASIDFTSIPAHWTHLKLVAYLRGTSATTLEVVAVQLNGDTAGNYDHIRSLANSAGASIASQRAQTLARVGWMCSGNSPANVFDSLEILIPHYAGTANQKAMQATGTAKQAVAADTDLNVTTGGGWWRSSAAVTRVTLFAGTGNLEIGSRATLYGMGRI